VVGVWVRVRISVWGRLTGFIVSEGFWVRVGVRVRVRVQ
jgi:hypothetical protein